MELPRKVLIGEGVLSSIGGFISDSTISGNIVMAAGTKVQDKVKAVVTGALDSQVTWVDVDAPDMENVDRVIESARGAGCIIGLGGGKSIDVGKLAAFKRNLPFFSVPTSASHDGISSPFASIRGLDRPYSVQARPPLGILADVSVIMSAPRRLLASGCGDLISKMTAVKDWQLSHEATGEYYGGYAANLALMSAEVVMQGSKEMGSFDLVAVRDLVEALISAGVAAGIAGSSRPCSGAEHLVSHYLDSTAPGVGLHGEKCGMSAIMMAKLHGLDWSKVRSSLTDVGAPTTASEMGLDRDLLIEALVKASTLRQDRYTILSKVRLDIRGARDLAESVGIL
jgi:glycerol-1-phosphate dehydrogenase [NAD(P)+]